MPFLAIFSQKLRNSPYSGPEKSQKKPGFLRVFGRFYGLKPCLALLDGVIFSENGLIKILNLLGNQYKINQCDIFNKGLIYDRRY